MVSGSICLPSEVCSRIIFPIEGNCFRSCWLSGSHNFERLIAFAQWSMAPSTSISIPSWGIFSFTAHCSSSLWSLITLAFPFTRRQSSKPGTRKSSPMFGFPIKFERVSTRLFPGLSGIKSVFSSTTWTKPAASPQGDTSVLPSFEAVPTKTKGLRCMKARQYLSGGLLLLQPLNQQASRRKHVIDPHFGKYCSRVFS